MADEAGNTPQQAQAVAAVQAENWAAAAALLLLEEQAIDAALAQQQAALQAAFRQQAARYILMFGTADSPADPARTADLLRPIVDQMHTLAAVDYATPLQHYADMARIQGVQYANRYLADPVSPQSVSIPESVANAIGGVAQSVADAATRVETAYEQLEIADFSDLTRAMARAAQVSTPVKQAAAWTVNRSANDGMAQVAARKGARLLWVAERDACVVCLALSGRLADPLSGQAFDELATFGKPNSAPAVWPPDSILYGPPRHPFCRCHLQLWFGVSTVEGGLHENALYNQPDIAAGVDLPASLRREAKRSVLRGWSLPSESMNVRLDAADRLLQRGAGMPKTVEARARKAVHDRKFSERSVPRPPR